MTGGQKLRAKVVRTIPEVDDNNHKRIKFLVELGDGTIDEIIDYNVLSDMIKRQEARANDDEERLWALQKIVGHQGPVSPGDGRYEGLTHNVGVEWEDGPTTFEPLSMVVKDDPVTIAKYAKANDLLDIPGWKHLKRYTRCVKMFNRMLKQAALSHDRIWPHLHVRGIGASSNQAGSRLRY